MKALSLLQPWATLITLGYKQFETRSWQTGHRGTVAIHASLGKPAEARQLCATCPEISAILAKHGLTFDTLPRGVVVGTCQIVEMNSTNDMPDVSITELACGDYSPDRWAWQLYKVKPLAAPVPCRGALSLWEVPAEVAAQFTYLPVPTKEALAAALTTYFNLHERPLQADDIRDINPDGLTVGGVDFQVHRRGYTDWYGVKVDAAGQPDPATIEQYPF